MPAADNTSPDIPASPDILRVLCLGDVIGRPGRRLLRDALPALRKRLAVDFVIANGENAAGGIGLTPETLAELTAAGVDAVTSGNHIWKHKSIYSHLEGNNCVMRPANYGLKAPGRGLRMFTLRDGTRLAVLNLLGRVYMDPTDCPFAAADAALAELAETDTRICLVDFHAEASSEKRAMAHHLDGRVSAVVGTHTHVQTADAEVSAQGTASLTDLGMCGVEIDSVIGMGAQAVLKRFRTGLPQPFIPAKGEASFNGACIDIDKNTGKALSIRLVRGKPCVAGDCLTT